MVVRSRHAGLPKPHDSRGLTPRADNATTPANAGSAMPQDDGRSAGVGLPTLQLLGHERTSMLPSERISAREPGSVGDART